MFVSCMIVDEFDLSMDGFQLQTQPFQAKS